MDKQAVVNSVTGGFAAIATQFVIESVRHMIPWLIVSGAVILCDLVFGIRKSLLMGDEVRFSSAVRKTMGKMVTYYAFVIMVVMIDVAAGGSEKIDKYACLLVCFIEGISILGNLLKPKGYNINLNKAIEVLFKNKFNVEGVDKVIEKEPDNKEANERRED